jgi:glycosyltransferase involved in cell wall biosynthesis
MRDIYRRRFGADSSVIPYCWTELRPSTDPAVLDRFGLEPGGYCLVAGRLIPENNIAEIAAGYLATNPNRPLAVLGAAPPRSAVPGQLHALGGAPGLLRLLGHVDDRSTFARLVASAAAYFHGHSVGGINPSLLEAMGCGARVVALDTAFNRQALGSAGTYFSLSASGPAPSLPEAVAALAAENDDVTTSLRDSARTRAQTRFALADVAGAYEDLLRDVASLQSRWDTARISTRWERDAGEGGSDAAGVQSGDASLSGRSVERSL